MKYWRQVADKTRRDWLKSEKVWSGVGQKKLTIDTEEKRQLKWFGHVQCMDESRRKAEFGNESRKNLHNEVEPRKAWEY